MVLLTDNVGGWPKVWADMIIKVRRSHETLPSSFSSRVEYSAVPEFGANEASMIDLRLKAKLH